MNSDLPPRVWRFNISNSVNFYCVIVYSDSLHALHYKPKLQSSCFDTYCKINSKAYIVQNNPSYSFRRSGIRLWPLSRKQHSKQYFWLVDPLDGTKEFIKKMASLLSMLH
jgi:3'-phosphoadenosine 5'-phosphosulfate (PAPS) 3'-phosphatase